jgi:hypothetical protein
MPFEAFSNADLNTTKSDEDYVYFTIPFTFISYPFSWVLPMAILAFLIFFSCFHWTAKRY